jgi:hypothetical protein
MAAYAVTDKTTSTYDSQEDVAVGLETLLQAIDSTKTIRYIDIIELPRQRQWQGVIIHDA